MTTTPTHLFYSYRRALTLSLLAATTQLGCSSTFDDLSLREEPAQQKPDAGCNHARPAYPPALATTNMRAEEFVVAVNKYDMGDLDQGAATERYRTMGYDLDGLCTGQGEGPSCTNYFGVLENPILEGPDGIDNAQGAVLYRVNDRQGSSATEGVNSPIESGIITTVLRVRHYNETSLDNDVEVAFFGATMLRGGQPNAPKWEGNDVWAAGEPWWVNNDDQGQPSIERPKFVDTKAYVTDWMLVARLDKLDVPPELALSQVIISARITKTDHGWGLTEGTIAGRARTHNLLANLHLIEDPETRDYICMGSKNYATHKGTICSVSDISFEPSDDPSTACDATSWGWHFNALPAKLSGTATAVPVRNCPLETSPANDSCENRE